MGIYNYEKIAERIRERLDSLDPNSDEYKRLLYVYKKTIGQEPTFSHRGDVEDYIRLKMISDPNLGSIPSLSTIASHTNEDVFYPNLNFDIGDGSVVPEPIVGAAVQRGEMVPSHGGSSYKAAQSGSTYDYGQFKSALDRYVAGAEQEQAQAEADRRADSVRIDIPGGYEGLQRIRQQAGGTPGGGSFSVMESTIQGGDSTEALQAYADNFRANEINRQIDLLERAFPAASRPPALDARLSNLYQARAQREQEAVNAMRAEAELIDAATTRDISAPAQAEYYRNYGPSNIKVAELGVDEARIRAGIQDKEMTLKYFDDTLMSVRQAVKDNQLPRKVLVDVTGIIYDPNLSFREKVQKVNDVLGVPAAGSPANLSEKDALLFNIP